MAKAIKLLARGNVFTTAQTDDKQVCISTSNDDSAQDLTDFKEALAISQDDIVFTSYERHHTIPAVLRGNPAAQPAEVAFENVAGLRFAASGSEYAYCEWEIPEDWDGTDITFEVDWFPDSGNMSGTDTIKWDVSYRAISEGQPINNGNLVTVSSTDNGDYNQYVTKHAAHLIEFDNADQPLAALDHIYFRITRDTSVANDFAGTVTVPAFEIAYNSIGLPTN